MIPTVPFRHVAMARPAAEPADLIKRDPALYGLVMSFLDKAADPDERERRKLGLRVQLDVLRLATVKDYWTAGQRACIVRCVEANQRRYDDHICV